MSANDLPRCHVCGAAAAIHVVYVTDENETEQHSCGGHGADELPPVIRTYHFCASHIPAGPMAHGGTEMSSSADVDLVALEHSTLALHLLSRFFRRHKRMPSVSEMRDIGRIGTLLPDPASPRFSEAVATFERAVSQSAEDS